MCVQPSGNGRRLSEPNSYPLMSRQKRRPPAQRLPQKVNSTAVADEKNDENENKSLQRIVEDPGQLDFDGSNKIINARIVEILVKKDTDPTDELKRLLDAEIDYNRQRFEIIRNHSKNDPDAIEDRSTKRFRRTQYLILLGVLPLILLAIPFVSIAAAVIFGTLSTIIVSGVLLNGRDREVDMSALVDVLKAIIGKKP